VTHLDSRGTPVRAICYDTSVKIVCSGELYADIDVYAGVIAYAELLRAQGHEAMAVITPAPNGSVPSLVQQWPVELARHYVPSADDSFILVDVSDPAHFEHFVQVGRVAEVIDHHIGFEEYWRDRIGAEARIEFIGAACTLVFEAWAMSGLADQMSTVSARLLACGILDNTLNFTAKATSERDEAAYAQLLLLGGLDADWPATYFSACEEEIAKDAVGAIENDSKILKLRTFDDEVLVGQVALWDGKALLRSNQSAFEKAFSAKRADWFINLISIGEKKSYFLANNPAVKQRLANLLDVRFTGNMAVSTRVWLRKEIIKQDHEGGL
jgi:inorganic pyrophosphatase/exopolyphosphatase